MCPICGLSDVELIEAVESLFRDLCFKLCKLKENENHIIISVCGLFSNRVELLINLSKLSHK